MIFDGFNISKLLFNDREISSILLNGQSILSNVIILPDIDIVTDGLVLWLDGSTFTNHAQTVTLIDKGTYSNNATATASGSYKKAIFIDGIDDKIVVPNAVSMTTWTMQFKVRIDTQSAYGRIISANNDAQYLYADYTNKRIRTTGTATYSNFYYTEGKTYDICQVSDGSYYKMYVDGILNTSMVKTSEAPITSVMFGNRTDNARGFKGAYSNILIYNRALSDSEIFKNYSSVTKNLNIQTGLVTDGLSLWFNGCDFYNSPATSTLLDKSGNGLNAAVSGFAYTSISGSDGKGGILFDKVDDLLTMPNNIMCKSPNFSVTFKINIGTLANMGLVECIDVGTGNIGWCIKTRSNGDLWFRMNDLDAYQNDAQFVGVLVAGVSTTITFTVSNNIVKLYKDGVLFGTKTVTKYVSVTNTADLVIGKDYSYERFGGTLYEALFYDRVLSAEEILQNHNVMTSKIVVYDSFNRDDATTLGMTETGQWWNIGSSDVWGISNNQAYKVSGGGLNAFVESGISNAKVSMKIGAVTNYESLLLRYSDSSNFIRLTNSDGFYSLTKMVAGSWTTLGTSSTPMVINDVIEVVGVNDSVKVYINGVELFSVLESFNITATKHGIRFLYATSKFDEFKVEAI